VFSLIFIFKAIARAIWKKATCSGSSCHGRVCLPALIHLLIFLIFGYTRESQRSRKIRIFIFFRPLINPYFFIDRIPVILRLCIFIHDLLSFKIGLFIMFFSVRIHLCLTLLFIVYLDLQLINTSRLVHLQLISRIVIQSTLVTTIFNH
jgi:hypothetical protein